MTLWKGKTRGGALGYKIFIFFLRNLDISFSYFILRFVAFYFVFFSPTAFKAIFNFYHYGLKFNFSRSIMMIYKNYYSFGQTLLDKVAVQAGFYSKFSYDFDDEKLLRQMIEEKTGGILISAHLGNWEIAAHLLDRLDAKFRIVMLDAEHQKVKKQLENVVGNKKIDVIVVKDDNSHIFEIYNSIKNGDFICFQGDRFIEGSKTIITDFLAKKAEFPLGVFYLGQKFNIPISFVFALKTAPKHYKFFLSPRKYFSNKSDRTQLDIEIHKIVNEYAYNLEQMVRKYPEQWYNYYSFFYNENQ